MVNCVFVGRQQCAMLLTLEDTYPASRTLSTSFLIKYVRVSAINALLHRFRLGLGLGCESAFTNSTVTVLSNRQKIESTIKLTIKYRISQSEYSICIRQLICFY